MDSNKCYYVQQRCAKYSGSQLTGIAIADDSYFIH